MATNQRHTGPADHIALPLPYDREPGEPVQVGGFVGIALNGGKKDAQATVWLDGSWELTVTGVTKPGTTVYITPTGALNVTPTGNQPFGHALDEKAAAAGIVRVRPLGAIVPTA